VSAGTDLGRIARFFETLCAHDDLSGRLPAPEEGAPTGPLVRSVNAFLDKMWLREFQLAAKREMLEKVVEIRTNEVNEILDNVKSGFLMADADQLVQDNYSQSCNQIFGRDDIKDERLADLMQLGEREAGNFSVMYEQVFAGFLPLQVATAQLPTSFEIDGRHFRIEGAPIVVGDEVKKIFFTVTDATELRRAESENALRLAMIEIIKQRDAFVQFLDDFRRMVRHSSQTSDPKVIRAHLHTMKGNLGCFGLHEIASMIHSIEELQEFDYAHVLVVERALRQFLEANKEVLELEYDDDTHITPTIEVDFLAELLDLIVTEPSYQGRKRAARNVIAKSRWVPCDRVMAGLHGLVKRLSARLGKDIELAFEGGEVLIDPKWTGEPLSTLVHLVRNSVDHGIEAPSQRGDKPGPGSIRIVCADIGDAWTITVEDDGRGIDVDALAKAAVDKGLCSAQEVAGLDEQGRRELIFVDQLSTTYETSMTSGRGVGAGAVLRSVRAIGGDVSVSSTKGQGTRVTLRIPYPPQKVTPPPTQTRGLEPA